MHSILGQKRAHGAIQLFAALCMHMATHDHKQVSSLWSSAPCICIFFVGGFALKVFPEHGTEVLSSVPKHKKAIIHLMEEIS